MKGKKHARSGLTASPSALPALSIDRGADSSGPQVATLAPRWYWLALGLLLLVNGAIRLRMLDVPLDRDEGEYAYLAQQMLHGVPPYASGYAMKFPGIYLAYAAAMTCFGESTRGIHWGALVVNLATIVLLFLIVRRLFGGGIAVVSAAFFALLALDVEIQGSSAQAENFVLLPALGGVYGLQHLAAAKPTLWGLALVGACFGVAGIIKQPGFCFTLFAVWYLVDHWRRESARSKQVLLTRLAVFALGALVPFALVCAWMKAAGVFDEFWFWTITYARTYATLSSPRVAFQSFLDTARGLFTSLPLVWISAAVGLLVSLFGRVAGSHRTFVGVWFVVSCLAVAIGQHFRTHYFVLVLPALALCAAIAWGELARWLCALIGRAELAPMALAGLTGAAVAISAWPQREYLFRATPNEIARLAYWSNPFPEAVEIARYINAHSAERGPILVLGSEPQIYFYAGRRAASPHIYMYPLTESRAFAESMQQQVLADIDRIKPEWIVLELADAAWGRRPAQDSPIMQWIGSAMFREYRPVGAVDVYDDKTVYRWLEDRPADFRPSSSIALTVLRRIPAAEGK